MRAIIVKDGKGPADNLYLGDAPKPTPAPGQVLVKIKTFGLNRMDIMQREGHYPVPSGASPILGVEFGGVIEEVGQPPADDDQSGEATVLRQAIKRWKTGDEVFGLAYGGAYAEYIVSPASHLIAKPQHLSFVEASSIPENWLTAFQALIVLAELKAGDSVLIHAGASGVGLAAIQLARMYGAKKVIATAGSKDKIDFLTSMQSGATAGVNYKEQDFSVEVKRITEDRGVNVVIDFIGASYWTKNIASMAPDGRMVMLGLMGGMKVQEADLSQLLFKRLRIQGSTLRARSVEYQASLISRFEKEVAAKITGSKGDGEARTYIHEVFPWEKIQDAHRDMEANKNTGKLIVEIGA